MSARKVVTKRSTQRTIASSPEELERVMRLMTVDHPDLVAIRLPDDGLAPAIHRRPARRPRGDGYAIEPEDVQAKYETARAELRRLGVKPTDQAIAGEMKISVETLRRRRREGLLADR